MSVLESVVARILEPQRTETVKEYIPYGDRICVRPDKPDERAAPDSQIIRPDAFVESKQFGTVIAVSDELLANYRAKDLEHVVPKVGDRVVWGDMLHIDLKHISHDDVVMLRFPAEVVSGIRYVERPVTTEKAPDEPSVDVLAQERARLGINR